MGCSSSCAIFEAFSTALEWLALHRLGASGALHTLDDFLSTAESKEKCQADLSSFHNLCEYIGAPIAGFYNSWALPLIQCSSKPDCQMMMTLKKLQSL